MSTLADIIFFAPTVLVTIGFGQYCLRALLIADWILERLYTNHREIWEKEGSPSGWLWHPPDKIIHVYGIGLTILYKWESSTPDWLSIDSEIEKQFKKMMYCKNKFLIGIPFIILVVIVSVIIGISTESLPK